MPPQQQQQILQGGYYRIAMDHPGGIVAAAIAAVPNQQQRSDTVETETEAREFTDNLINPGFYNRSQMLPKNKKNNLNRNLQNSAVIPNANGNGPASSKKSNPVVPIDFTVKNSMAYQYNSHQHQPNLIDSRFSQPHYKLGL